MKRLLLTLAVYAAICGDVRVWGAEKPKLALHISPRAQLAIPGQSAYIRATLRIMDPGQLLGCFKITWAWGDGCVSVEESDCDPYLLVDERPKLYVPVPRMHAYRHPGVFEVRVTVWAYPATATGHVTARTQQVAMVLEPGQLEDQER